ncbi:diguanylate cyclase domain-containing protein [Lyngbya sp. CCY1209]|uniref:diguanylate cyclase domain-containing protein n=1 Tax=Lyngbya sp. CCY1209 TaxID=2886103 RepID=UPI002D2168B4|nr:diguanylate cyclase [Lyngbya sp. CCY1209]MEB3883196.1 diguanylate cyclase [Lyngbya sp. CCY1209]
MNLPNEPPTPSTILVVDDIPNNLRLLQDLLRKQGYDVRLAPSGKLALRSLTRFAPDLILLDIMMPEMDGYQVCRQIKADPEMGNVPVIFLSALDEGLDKAKAFEVGGADYITKPFQMEEVLARIRNQLALHSLQKQLQETNQTLAEQNRELQLSARETRLLLRATWAIGRAPDFRVAIAAVLDAVCENILWEYGEAWQPDSECQVLEYIANPQGTDARFAAFQRDSSRRTFAPGRGIAGRVWLSRQPEWIEDCSTCSPDIYDRAPIAERAGLKAMFGVPILLGDEVSAVLVFYNTRAIPCQPRTLELVRAVAAQLSFPLQQARLYQQLQQANRELERLARLDGLTQVANRRHFDEVLGREWRRMRRERSPLAVILCDVDYFKNYNDQYGHLAGDDCLIQVARALDRSAMRPTDLVARYGGEEFAVILSNTDTQGAVEVARRIQDAIAALEIPHETSGVSDRLTVSQGIFSLIPTPESSPDRLLHAADVALYQAKQKGRDCFAIGT